MFFFILITCLLFPVTIEASLIQHGTTQYSTSKWDATVEYWVYDPGGGAPEGSGSGGFSGSYSYWYHVTSDAGSESKISSLEVSFSPNAVTGYGNTGSSGALPSSQSVDNSAGRFTTTWSGSDIAPGNSGKYLYMTSDYGPTLYDAIVKGSDSSSATGNVAAPTPAPTPEWSTSLLVFIGLFGLVLLGHKGYISVRE